MSSSPGPMLRSRQREGGFTLLELLFALGILVFGMTSLLGVLSVGVSTRRTAEQRLRAAQVAEHVLQRIEQEFLAAVPLTGDEENEEDLEIPAIEPLPADEYSGLEYTVRFKIAPELPDLVLATVAVSWLEQGDGVSQEFHRILPRQVPFSRRLDAERSPR